MDPNNLVAYLALQVFQVLVDDVQLTSLLFDSVQLIEVLVLVDLFPQQKHEFDVFL
jgi:hypothetical protein